MPLNLSHLAEALNQFPGYDAIDVFADDVAELRPGGSAEQGKSFQLEIFPERGIARLSKGGASSSKLIASSSITRAIEAAKQRKGAGLLDVLG